MDQELKATIEKIVEWENSEEMNSEMDSNQIAFSDGFNNLMKSITKGSSFAFAEIDKIPCLTGIKLSSQFLREAITALEEACKYMEQRELLEKIDTNIKHSN